MFGQARKLVWNSSGALRTPFSVIVRYTAIVMPPRAWSLWRLAPTGCLGSVTNLGAGGAGTRLVIFCSSATVRLSLVPYSATSATPVRGLDDDCISSQLPVSFTNLRSGPPVKIVASRPGPLPFAPRPYLSYQLM